MKKIKELALKVLCLRFEKLYTNPPKIPYILLKKWYMVRHYVAANPNTPPEVLKVLARDSILSILARKDEDHEVMRMVSGHPNACFRTLSLLSKDGDCFIRAEVARNINTPEIILSILAKDKSRKVRRMVSGHPKTPLEILTFLARDKDCWVRANAAYNINIPTNTLVLLARDKAQIVSARAEEVLELRLRFPNLRLQGTKYR